jgi:choline-sulfatase
VVVARLTRTILFIAAALELACSRTQPPDATAGVRASDAPTSLTIGVEKDATTSARLGDGDAASASPTGPPPDLNVLLITIDALRADMPWAGYERPIAPNLTLLEKRAVSYTHAYSLSSYTSMSIGGFLGGRYPGEMKRDGYFFGTYRDNQMFPELLQAAGVKTLAAHAHLYFKKGAAGFDRGFDVYEIVPGLKWNPNTDENITSPQSEKLAESILGDPANTSGRFFAWFHFLDPHDQYMKHPDLEPYGKKARDLYDGEVTFTDRYIAKLLEFVGHQSWAGRTAIIVTADHGEVFGEHGVFRHGFELWQPLIRVSWMFVLPGVAPRHIDVNRSHIDLAPTILDLMGVSPQGMEGKSLVAELYGKSEPEARDVIVDLPRTSDSDRRRAIIHDHYKLIAFGDDTNFQVFDLDADPEESQSLAKTDRAKYDEMVALYKEKRQEIKDVGPYVCRTLKGAPVGRGY